MGKLEHRQSESVIRVLNAQGAPLEGKRVRASLTSPEFLCGCGAFEFIEMYDDYTDARRREYLSRVLELWNDVFNYGTLPFYQGRYEPVEGRTREAATLRAAEKLAQSGVKLKGHPLVWHTVSAKWLLKYDADYVLENQLARIRRELGAFSRAIKYWDVINEVVIMPIFDKETNAITKLCKRMGRVGLVKAVFEQARACDPDATLLINDFDLRDDYARLIDECLGAGVSIDAIGLQTHQHQGAKGVDKLGEILERFSVFRLPLHFTENTFVSGHLMPADIVDLNDYKIDSWPSTPEGEDRQARDLIEMMDFIYACPLVEAATYWDFIDGGWLGAPSGLIRVDGTPKPAYYALKERVKRDWSTRAELVTDANGECKLKGVRGEYAIECEGETRAAALTKGKTGDNQSVIEIKLT